MKYGVFSDIHGNLEAFMCALHYFAKAGVTHYLFCGDLIGYGPDPKACVQQYTNMVSAGIVKGVMGNHDAIVLHPELREYFHEDALQALDWSLEQLTKAEIRSISFLPEVVRGENYTMVHGTPRDPLKEYFFNSLQYRVLYPEWSGQILFVGHTHMPFYMAGDENECQVHTVRGRQLLQLDPNKRYVINPGSTGKPRDNDVRAAFGIWDTDAGTFEFIRAPYDCTVTQEKMTQAGLSQFLIDSLSLGL